MGAVYYATIPRVKGRQRPTGSHHLRDRLKYVQSGYVLHEVQKLETSRELPWLASTPDTA
jgi:hypothetical protein